MKYILVIGDGMADDPVDELGGKTPLETANKPYIDALAAKGVLGAAKNCPEGYPVGSETAIMSLFGCSPKLYYTGRAPIEAAAQGISMQPGDVEITYADTGALEKDFGFAPGTPLREGLRKFAEWYKRFYA